MLLYFPKDVQLVTEIQCPDPSLPRTPFQRGAHPNLQPFTLARPGTVLPFPILQESTPTLPPTERTDLHRDTGRTGGPEKHVGGW